MAMTLGLEQDYDTDAHEMRSVCVEHAHDTGLTLFMFMIMTLGLQLLNSAHGTNMKELDIHAIGLWMHA